MKTLLLFLLSACLISCSQTQPKICFKNGQAYGLTSDRIRVITWDACYRRGVSFMEGQCWEYAIEEFKQAIDLRYQDQRQVRAYGMHFREEYFPHRELGICYFRLGDTRGALPELKMSLSQTPSARARYYLNQARRSYLLQNHLDTTRPVIHLEISKFTNQTPFQVQGVVQDDQYVASVSINHKPLFIELAAASIPFSRPVDLEGGWNKIQVTARDLVGHQVQQSIRVYLDQQGPLVITRQPDHKQGHLFVVAYDRSGISSFKLNQKEIPGLDQLRFIDLPLSRDHEAAISFWARDRAGNITQGRIFPHEARRSNNRLACLGPVLLAGNQTEGISFDITSPAQENLTTFYPEIFLEGKIKTQKGIKKIELNGRQLFKTSDIQNIVEKNRNILIKTLIEQKKDPLRYMQLLQTAIQSYNLYYLNQKISLSAKITDLNLRVEDKLGNKGSRHYRIQKIPRQQILKSEQRLVLALLPFDENSAETYINTKLMEAFISQGRFTLVEREKLPSVLIEKNIQTGHQNDLARKIGQMTAAEGVICGYIHRREDGTEILARFIEVKTGLIRLGHDVFTPLENKENLDTITTGLAIKFRDSFPICTGSIIARQGKTIQVNVGSEKNIFPGMIYNIFENERKLIGKASISEVHKGFSRAEITEKYQRIEPGYRVRTR